MKMRGLVLALILLAPRAVQAQITPTYTFVAATVINPDEVNTNFALLSQALNRTGGTMTGTLTSRLLLPSANDTYDLGQTGTRYRHLWLSGNATIAGDVAVAGSQTVAGDLTVTGSLSAGGGGGVVATSIACTGCIGATQIASTAVTPGSAGSATSIPTLTVDADGRVTSLSAATPQLTLSSTYFSSLSGASLTGIPETAIVDGSLLARLAANETVSGNWTFSNNLQFSTTGVMSRTSRSTATNYTAATDGFVVVNCNSGTDGIARWEILSDANTTPTTVVGRTECINGFGSSVVDMAMAPVLKGMNYRINVTTTNPGSTVTIEWVPLGTGG